MSAGFRHTLDVVSRSRRAAGTLLAIDIDDTDETLAAIADRAARTAYSPLSMPEEHAALAVALLEAIEGVEAIPGQPATFGVDLEDGRLARATRTIYTP